VIDALLDLLRLREFGLVDLAEILIVAFVFYRLLLLTGRRSWPTTPSIA
jgi:hypothetical protein